MIKLTPRLLKTAELICPCDILADIGTDHAYLPVYVLQNKIANHAIACDINDGPLMNAANTVMQFKLSDKIELRLSDGLKEVGQNEVDTVVIAGMGGELIADIIGSCEWKNQVKQFVLQPMTHFEDLRRFLCNNGFTINKEVTVKEGNRVYLCFSAVYDGKLYSYPEWYYYTGELIHSCELTDIEFCNKIISRLEKKVNSLEKSGNDFVSDKKILEEIKYEQSF